MEGGQNYHKYVSNVVKITGIRHSQASPSQGGTLYLVGSTPGNISSHVKYEG